MEEGLAVPHARMASIRRPMVFFGRSADGIEWDTADGKPVRLVFLILTPSEAYDAQVQILGCIAKAMSQEQARESLLKAGDAHDIWPLFQSIFAARHIRKKG